ncbi:hypothetical protein QAD02_010976 [Eretmocerus hayati]|uniref:Uncharacterized protein n=1 Tax=Eretmocerus hayati TaxID=131215 RepID=A0ACC2NVC3_9HYME|nr:hypothetical protein QAD02_010976 [Eretmocerus hayati]
MSKEALERHERGREALLGSLYRYKDIFDNLNPSWPEIKAMPNTSLIVYKLENIHDLIALVTNKSIPQDSKIGSVIRMLYPYTAPRIDYLCSIKNYHGHELRLAERGNYRDIRRREMSGDEFAMLAVFVLGPVYTQSEQIQSLLFQHIQEAGTSIGLSMPQKLALTQIIAKIGWKVEPMSNSVCEILAAAICYTNEGKFDPDVSIQKLYPLESLISGQSVSKQAIALLKKARITYQLFRSSSIRLVIPILEEFTDALDSNIHFWAPEIRDYKKIEASVRNSPFLGIRSFLPEKYRIKNFPKLVMCSLEYYRLHIQSDREKNLFKDNEIMEIKSQFTTYWYQMVSRLTSLLPPPQIANLAKFVKHISFDRAQITMANAPFHQRGMVLDILKFQCDKGPWATSELEKEQDMQLFFDKLRLTF